MHIADGNGICAHTSRGVVIDGSGNDHRIRREVGHGTGQARCITVNHGQVIGEGARTLPSRQGNRHIGRASLGQAAHPRQ